MTKLKSLNDFFKSEESILHYIAKKPEVFFMKCSSENTLELSSIQKWENEKKSMGGIPVYQYTEEDVLMNKKYNEMSHKANVNRDILKHYKVDYTDANNFIYVYHNKFPRDYQLDGDWDYIGLVKLYMKEFLTKLIRCQNISSFPIYPNMEFCELDNCVGSEHKLTNFPVQPNMIDCSINNHDLKQFPIQPKMEICNLVNNSIETFSVQPAMISCNVSKNFLETFPNQPNAISISINDNKLKTISVQPKMKHCFINNNCLETFPTQPNMTLIYIDSPGDLTLSLQPKLKSIKAL